MKHVIMSDGWAFCTGSMRGYGCRHYNLEREGEFVFLHVEGGVTPSASGLPENAFQIAKVNHGYGDNEIVIRRGQDTTNRCLLFVGCKVEPGEEALIFDLGGATTGALIKQCKWDGQLLRVMEAIVLLNLGEKISFMVGPFTFKSKVQNPRLIQIHTYVWNGAEIKEEVMSKDEWDLRQQMHNSSEVL